MHGLMNRAIEVFVRDTYGRKMWAQMACKAQLETPEFEAMLMYPDAVTVNVLDAVCAELGKTRAEVLEDIGTYIVSHSSSQALRRLLRFAGTDFVEFLNSLDDLPARARLAVPDLALPPIELREHSQRRFSIMMGDGRDGEVPLGHVLIGLLRAMADDYGALAFLEHKGTRGGAEIIEVELLDEQHSDGRSFTLGATG